MTVLQAIPTSEHYRTGRKYVPKGRAPMTAEQKARTERFIRRLCTSQAMDQLESSRRCGNHDRVEVIEATLAAMAEERKARHDAKRAEMPPARPRRQRELRLLASWRPAAEAIAQQHGLTVNEMLSGSGTRKIYPARVAFWRYLRRDRGVSYGEIGRRTGGYDHSTVWYGIENWEAKVAANNNNPTNGEP